MTVVEISIKLHTREVIINQMWQTQLLAWKLWKKL